MPELLERVEVVHNKVVQLFARYFVEAAKIDYLTLFTTSEDERQRLDGEAASLGRLIGEKNGKVYRLPHTVVRICNPRETDLLGCADFIVADYADARQWTCTHPGFSEMHKANHGIEHDIIELIDPKLRVAMYIPSIRMLGSAIRLDGA